MKRSVLAICATGLSFGLTVVAASSASADPTGTASLTGGTVDAKGAGVSVSFTYSCTFDAGADVQVANAQAAVTQKVGGKNLAQASNLFDNRLVCDGTEHTSTMRGAPDSGPAFKSGVALVHGGMSVCQNFSCLDVPLVGEVQLTKK